MNLKSSILKIAVVIALICMLVPVIAAEDVDDSVYAEGVGEGTDAVSEGVSVTDELTADEDGTGDDVAEDETDETEEDEGDDVAVDAQADGEADLQIEVITPMTQTQVGDLAGFGIIVYNNGPDTATNVMVSATLVSGSIYTLSAEPTQGEVMFFEGILYWFVGDLAPGEFAYLPIIGIVTSDEDIFLVATVTSDTPDPDESNNIAFGFIDVVEAQEEAPVEELPATGNPIAMALLAVLAVVGVSLRRKF